MSQPFRRILFPTDFSEGANAALAHALELQRQFGASLTLLHVYELPIAYTEVYAFSADLIGAIEQSARREMAKAVEHARERARQLDPQASSKIEAKVMVGSGATTIVEEAKRGGYDLIVMGTHGRTGMRHLFIGSMAERVVRTAPCPVLTIRGVEEAP